MDEDNEGDFRDVPEEAGGEPSPEQVIDLAPPRKFAQAAAPKPAPKPVQQEKTIMQEYEENPELDTNEDDDNEDYSEVLSDARLRLEQGRLYELIMNNDFFSGTGYDPKAIKNVEKEIRNFAKERMEIMLGMRQEASKEVGMSLDNFPFNALEVEALKALASAATQGASAESEPFTAVAVAPRKTTLNKINVRSNPSPRNPIPDRSAKASKPLPKAPAAPVKRPKVDEAIQRILQEEGVTLDEINQVFNPNHKPLTPEELATFTQEQMIERNKDVAQRLGKPVKNAGAVPMPPQEHIDAMYAQRANVAAAHPQMQMIMNLLQTKKN
jgi:hypothetical protein